MNSTSTLPEVSNPFPGLRCFLAEEDYLFFGRHEQIEDLLRRLRTNRLVAVVGTSGSGKSSLVRAGLLPAVLGGGMSRAGSAWEIAVMRPGGSPLTHLAGALCEAGLYDADAEDAQFHLQATLSRSRNGLVEAVRQSRTAAGSKLLLVVDQFEELFRFNRASSAGQEESILFVNLLLHATQQADQNVFVVLTMRSDFLGECSQFLGLAEAVNDGEFLIPRMTRDQIQEAIEGPIRVRGAEIAPRLLFRLLNDVEDNQDQLPVLQHALMRTWDLWAKAATGSQGTKAGDQRSEIGHPASGIQHPASGPLDLEHYEATGGMHQALSRHADEIFIAFPSDDHRAVAESIFKALTERGPDGRGIRRPTRLASLVAIAGVERAVATAVIEAYRAPGVTFLMPPATTVLDDNTVIDISHESLMRVWDRLRGWVEEEVQSARIYRRLLETAALHSEKRAGLYHDPDLQIALSWRETAGPNAAWAEQYGGGFEGAMRFLDQSREAAEREEKEREAARQRELERAQKFAEAQAKVAQLFKRFAGSLAVGLILAVALTIWAFKLRQEARKQEATAQQQRQLAEEKEREALQQQQRAELSEANTAALLYGANLNLVQANFEQSNIPQTRRLLDQTRSHADRGFEWYYWQRQLHRETRILRGHAGQVLRVAFSPDGRRILTQGQDQVIIIRDAASGEEQLRVTAGNFLQFSPDGERLLCSNNQGVQIRNASTGAELISTDLVSLGTFTPDGKQFATVRGVRAVFRDAVTGKEVSSFKAFLHSIHWFANPIAFSPDGRWMLAANSGLHEGVALHDAVTGEIENIFAKGEFVQTGAFSPDGRRIVTWNLWSGGPTIWDISQPDRPLARLSGLSGGKVRFSPDGRRLLTGSGPRTTLWDAETFKELGRFEGHTGNIRDVAFSPDGQWVATASEDGTARIWAADSFAGPQVLQSPQIFVGAFSPDGRYLATGYDGVAVIWETATRKPLHRLQVYHPVPGKIRAGREADVGWVSFSPDGRRLVASGNNYVAIVFDVESGQTLRTLDHASTNPNDRFVGSPVFSPDGKQIVTMNNLKVRTWDADSGRLLRTKAYTKTNGLHTVPPVGFTPDGRLYCASNEEVTIWDAATDEELFHMPVEKSRQRNPSIAFSPDGKRFALSSHDWAGAIQIHDAASGELLRTLEGHRSGVFSLEFSPDGDRLLSGSTDATVKIWDWRSERELLSFNAPQVVTHARFTPDGQMIFAAGYFQDGLLWEAATQEQVTAWEAEDAAGTTQWAAMTKELDQRREAERAANEEAGKARRAAFVNATEEKLARLGDPALLGKLPGAIRQWLALSAPYNRQHPEIQLDEEQIANEAQLRPRASETERIAEGSHGALQLQERVWTALQLEDYRLDFRTAIKSDDAATVAYAVSYILSERDQTGLVLKVGSDYHAKIYLNQREIYRRVNPPTAEPDRDTVTGVELKAGLNVLVYKVVRSGTHGDLPWSGSVRFTNADGSPAQGLTVTLDPDAKQ